MDRTVERTGRRPERFNIYTLVGVYATIVMQIEDAS